MVHLVNPSFLRYSLKHGVWAQPTERRDNKVTITELINERLEETGQPIAAAARELDTTRPTLYSWMRGAVPEPDDHRVKTIAAWTGESEETILEMILIARGIDPSLLKRLAKNRLNAEGKVQQPTVVGRKAHSHLQLAS